MTHVPWHPDDLEPGEEIHGIESVELYSVGIDIGTTTTHLMISRLVARREGGEFSSSFHIDEKERVFESDVFFTPYEDDVTIDVAELQDLIWSAYDDADVTPEDIDTGAVIITGEASRKENAEAIAELFSGRAGEFVCATAGADLEALMSAHGSGAVELSFDQDIDVLHVDIGGGTTKLAYIVDGIVEETASINVGARLVEFSGPDGSLSRIEKAAQTVADGHGISLSKGGQLTADEKETIASELAEALVTLIDGNDSPLVKELMVTDEPTQYPFDVLTFSGGGAEYIYDDSPNYYGDLGPELGAAISRKLGERGYEIETLDAGIRATAIGSTEHNVQISGNTISIEDESKLPLRNIPMVPFAIDHDDEYDAIVAEMEEKLELYDIDVLEEPFAFGFHLHGPLSFDFLDKIVDAAIDAWEAVDGLPPFVLAFETDVALNAGKLAMRRLDTPVIAVDNVELAQFGYIDIGEPLEDTNAVPLTVKSLLFEG